MSGFLGLNDWEGRPTEVAVTEPVEFEFQTFDAIARRRPNRIGFFTVSLIAHILLLPVVQLVMLRTLSLEFAMNLPKPPSIDRSRSLILWIPKGSASAGGGSAGGGEQAAAPKPKAGSAGGAEGRKPALTAPGAGDGAPKTAAAQAPAPNPAPAPEPKPAPQPAAETAKAAPPPAPGPKQPLERFQLPEALVKPRVQQTVVRPELPQDLPPRVDVTLPNIAAWSTANPQINRPLPPRFMMRERQVEQPRQQSAVTDAGLPLPELRSSRPFPEAPKSQLANILPPAPTVNKPLERYRPASAPENAPPQERVVEQVEGTPLRLLAYSNRPAPLQQLQVIPEVNQVAEPLPGEPGGGGVAGGQGQGEGSEGGKEGGQGAAGAAAEEAAGSASTGSGSGAGPGTGTTGSGAGSAAGGAGSEGGRGSGNAGDGLGGRGGVGTGRGPGSGTGPGTIAGSGSGPGGAGGGSGSGSGVGAGSGPGNSPGIGFGDGPGGKGGVGTGDGSGFSVFGGEPPPGQPKRSIEGGDVPIRMAHPETGQFDVVVLQAGSVDSLPITRQILTGQPVYTVYIGVGTREAWIMQYAIREDPQQGPPTGTYVVSLSGPEPVKAPYPIRTTVPPSLRIARPGFVMIYGIVGTDGRWKDIRLEEGRIANFETETVPFLMEWEFRPAIQGGGPVEVEVLLAIPPA